MTNLYLFIICDGSDMHADTNLERLSQDYRLARSPMYLHLD